MQRRRPIRSRQQVLAATAILIVIMTATVPAFARISGGKGNKPLTDPGWPQGAAAVFNQPARIGWWEGPPFGGGQWHAEYRGDAKAFNAVLADFARMDAKTKRLVVHDGVGSSFWLNPNREPAKQAEARMDWRFMVWERANWEYLRKLPADLNPTDRRDSQTGPPAQIDVYTGGNVHWPDVIVPEGLQVVDKRLQAHGFTPADGIVLEGKVIDAVTKQPIAAQMQLHLVQPRPTGGYDRKVAGKAAADEKGRWVLKQAPPGWHGVVVEATGYAPRVVGHARLDNQPRWCSYDCELSRVASVSGRVVDDAGGPLPDVDVRLGNVVSEADDRYESPDRYLVKSDRNGRFRFEQVPVGSATIRPNKSGYCRPGLGQPIAMPVSGLELTMIKSANVRVTVDFGGADRPKGYIVQIEPEGGSGVGKWSGSGKIKADNQISFENVPPGRYVLRGHPNPSTAEQWTKPITIDLHGGQLAEITLPAKAK